MQAGDRIKAVPVKHGLVTFGQGENSFEKMSIVFKILEGPSLDQTVRGDFGFKGKGEDFTAQVMRRCGWDGESDIESPWKYKQVRVTVEAEEYTNEQGDTRTRYSVKYVNDLDSKGYDAGALIDKKKADPVRAQSFKESFMASQRAKREAAGDGGGSGSGGGTVPSNDHGSGAVDDDIPF
jgi:hypothetical protein